MIYCFYKLYAKMISRNSTCIYRHSEINKKVLLGSKGGWSKTFPSPLAENTEQLNIKMLDLQISCAYNNRGSIKKVK